MQDGRAHGGVGADLQSAPVEMVMLSWPDKN